MMKLVNRKLIAYLGAAYLLISVVGCKTPNVVQKDANTAVPEQYTSSKDTLNSGKIQWKEYFADEYLNALIEEALSNNQELNITLQEIQISQNEIRARKGEYLPFVGLKGSAEVEKVGRYTSQGANDATTEIKPGVETPDPLPNYMFGAFASWEVDVWGKLHNAKRAAVSRYLASVEGKNFVVTNLIAEIANSYYELLALDNQLNLIKQNIEIQANALRIVKLQKESARVTELAVKRFEAQLLNTKSLQFNIEQKIVETENKINFLVGRFPQKVDRDTTIFTNLSVDKISTGLPSDLLSNRPDIKQAELELAATKLDVKSAKARFYPSFGISAGLGFQAFDPKYLIKSPQSLLYSVAGDLVAPLINRNAIKASYKNANAKQIQAVFNYERTILNAYVEVANQISMIKNMDKTFEFKFQQVNALDQSVEISNNLFSSARADYMEVLLTQREALESKFELIEVKMKQLNAKVNIYRALGGGWN